MKKKAVFPGRRAAGNGNVVSLFPFLAVLLCTMGALIMLLVVIAQSVRQQPESADLEIARSAPVPETAVSEDKPQQPDTEPVDAALPSVEEAREQRRLIAMQAEDAAWFSGELEESRKKLEEQLAAERAKLAFQEKQAQDRREEIERLLKVAREVERSGLDKTEEKSQQRELLKSKTEALARSEEDLKRLRQEIASKPRSYAIVPFQGRDGTFRKPMFIECRDNKVVLQPEGIELNESDFLAADRPDNALDSALRAARQYMVETNQLGRDEEPYPLFVVRPSGIDIFGVAKSSLGTWSGDFGYELMEENVVIDYPPLNREQRQRMDTQVLRARERLEGLIAMRYEEMRRRPTRQYRIGPGGKVERVDGGREFLRGGRSIAGRDEADPPGRSNNPDGSNGSPRTDGNAPSNGTYARSRVGAPIASHGHGSFPGDTDERSSGNHWEAAGANGFPGGMPANPEGTVSGDTAQERPGSQWSGVQVSGVQGQSRNHPEPGELSGAVSKENATPEKTGGRVSEDGMAADGGAHHTLSSGTASSGNASSGNASSGTASSGNASSGNASSGNASDNASHNISHNTSGSSETTPGAVPGMASPFTLGDGSSTQLQTPTIQIGTMQPDNWGLPDAAAKSVAVSRTVKIRCEQDAFTLPAQPGLRRPVRIDIPVDASIDTRMDARIGAPAATRTATGALVKVLWNYMETWGTAGERQYWQPVLKVQVEPGAEFRFEELRRTLHNSGILIERQN